MPEAPPELTVFLNRDPVGRLSLLSYGTHSADELELSFDDSYLASQPRPVLGQHFEDDLARVHRSRMRAPPFFSNLLPEGLLRELVAQRADVSPEREFYLLAYLGEDLPGAVTLRAGRALPPPDAAEAPVAPEPSTPLRFSLAGVQLKLSMIREGRGLRLPASGRGGDWLLKLPDARAGLVPENEYSMMRWAREVGLDVPEIDLVPISELRGLPPEVAMILGHAFAIRRFDRPPDAERIHIEDFAQVLGVYASEKYDRANHETVGNILLSLGGMEDLLEYAGRIVFIAAIGNSDAHLKNWSLIYRDRVRARLAPAYDMVSTIQYPQLSDDLLGLNLARSKRFEDISLASFEKLATRLRVDPAQVQAKVRATVEATLDAWSKLRPELPIPEAFKARIDWQLGRVPLFRR